MSVPPLEAVADSIERFEGWDPKTRSYVNRNSGNLRLSLHPDAGVAIYPVDPGGYTIFPDRSTGYNALLRDLRAKFSGQNSHGLGPASTLLSMMEIYSPSSDSNNPLEYAKFIARWVGIVLNKPLTEQSELANIWMPGK